MSKTAATLAAFIKATPSKLDALQALLTAADHPEINAGEYAELATLLIAVHG